MEQTTEVRQLSLSYLRAFVTLLVVAFHSVIVYLTIKPPHVPSFTTQPLYWQAFPVLDKAGWPGFDLFMGWNDIFFMPLMFFVSGIFVWPSLKHRGVAGFLKRRFLRLAVPFMVIVAVLAPLSYYPAYLGFGANPQLSAYVKAWLSLKTWPVGPAWFLWVLLTFDCLAAVCFLTVPRTVEFLGKLCGRAGQRPIIFFLALVALSQAAYLPLVHILGAYTALSFGPFFVQGSKTLLYLLYFCAGAGAGIFGEDAGLFARAGRLARRWPLWGAGALVCFAAWIGAYLAGKPQTAATVLSFSCAATSLFFTAIFVRFAHSSRIADSFSGNAYGIYLLHYVFVVWLQWTILRFAAPAILKGFTVLAFAVALSWATAALLRRNQMIAHVI